MRSGPQVTPRDGNATVPANAPIQPPQAFVDNITKLNTLASGGVDYSNQGITKLSGSFFATWALIYSTAVDAPNMNFSGNALDASSVDGILAALIPNLGSMAAATINLSGGTSAAPTRTSVIVSGAGSTSDNTGYTLRGQNNGKNYYNRVGLPDSTAFGAITWGGGQWSITSSVGDIDYTSTDDTVLPGDATFTTTAGINPPPIVSAPVNLDEAALVAAGWTVTTN